uniref:Uncharacterized protein n=1 Tax=Rhizophora mucronata TaxID=61149 RepID=A0A2P2QXN6_RHIMU
MTYNWLLKFFIKNLLEILLKSNMAPSLSKFMILSMWSSYSLSF